MYNTRKLSSFFRDTHLPSHTYFVPLMTSHNNNNNNTSLPEIALSPSTSSIRFQDYHHHSNHSTRSTVTTSSTTTSPFRNRAAIVSRAKEIERERVVWYEAKIEQWEEAELKKQLKEEERAQALEEFAAKNKERQIHKEQKERMLRQLREEQLEAELALLATRRIREETYERAKQIQEKQFIEEVEVVNHALAREMARKERDLRFAEEARFARKEARKTEVIASKEATQSDLEQQALAHKARESREKYREMMRARLQKLQEDREREIMAARELVDEKLDRQKQKAEEFQRDLQRLREQNKEMEMRKREEAARQRAVSRRIRSERIMNHEDNKVITTCSSSSVSISAALDEKMAQRLHDLALYEAKKMEEDRKREEEEKRREELVRQQLEEAARRRKEKREELRKLLEQRAQNVQRHREAEIIAKTEATIENEAFYQIKLRKQKEKEKEPQPPLKGVNKKKKARPQQQQQSVTTTTTTTTTTPTRTNSTTPIIVDKEDEVLAGGYSNLAAELAAIDDAFSLAMAEEEKLVRSVSKMSK